MGVIERWDPKPVVKRLPGSSGDRRDDLYSMRQGLLGEKANMGGVGVWRQDANSPWIPEQYLTQISSSVASGKYSSPEGFKAGDVVVPTENGQLISVRPPSGSGKYASYWNPNEARWESMDTQEGFWAKNTSPIAKALISVLAGVATGGAASGALSGSLGATGGSIAGSAIGGATQGGLQAGMTEGGDVGKGMLTGAITGSAGAAGNAIGGTTGAAVGGALGGAGSAAAAGGTSSDIGNAALTGAATGALSSEIGQAGKEYGLSPGVTKTLSGAVTGAVRNGEQGALQGGLMGAATGFGGEYGGKVGSQLGGMLAKNYIAGEKADAAQAAMRQKYQQYLNSRRTGGMMSGTTAGNSQSSRFTPQQMQQ